MHFIAASSSKDDVSTFGAVLECVSHRHLLLCCRRPAGQRGRLDRSGAGQGMTSSRGVFPVWAHSGLPQTSPSMPDLNTRVFRVLGERGS